MSLYNMLFGKNPHSSVILAIIGLKESDVERFRDCSMDNDGIQIYARTGGGNRESYPNETLTSSPHYLRDEDDDYDSTYAHYYFKFPPEIEEDCKQYLQRSELGVSGKFIQWLCKTLERKPTENDIWTQYWEKQNNLIGNAKRLNIFETNGHTVVPLDDSSLQVLLENMEAVGGKQLSYSVMPYKLAVKENVPRWRNESPDNLKTDMCRVKVEIVDPWQIDDNVWARWQVKYGEKFPKSLSTIAESVAIVKLKGQK